MLSRVQLISLRQFQETKTLLVKLLIDVKAKILKNLLMQS